MITTKLGKWLFSSSPQQWVHELGKRRLKRDPLPGFDDRHPCVFVLSTGRSGTETLAALGELSGNVLAYHEPHPTLYSLSKLLYESPALTLDGAFCEQAFLLARKELLGQALDCSRGYLETSPQGTFSAAVIQRVVPNVRFIHVVRDPRDVARSGMRRGWYNGHKADATRIVPRANSEVAQHWKSLTLLQKNLWLWSETNRWIIDFTADLPSERKLLIRAEDVFAGREEVMEMVFAFLATPMPPLRKIQRVLSKRLNAQKKGSFPKPCGWSRDMRHDAVVMAGGVADTLGYAL